MDEYGLYDNEKCGTGWETISITPGPYPERLEAEVLFKGKVYRGYYLLVGDHVMLAIWPPSMKEDQAWCGNETYSKYLQPLLPHAETPGCLPESVIIRK